METMLNFLLAEGNSGITWMILTIVVASVVGPLTYGIIERRRFNSAWYGILEEVVDDLNSKGAEMVESLIEIAMISADKNAALIIGMAKKEFEDRRESPEFYKKLTPIISIINDKNHTANLNSDYAAARDAVKEAESLIGKFSRVGDFESLVELAIKADKIRKEISLATKNLQGILYGLRLQYDEAEKPA